MGIDASLGHQYQVPLDKFERVLNFLNSSRTDFSLPVRLVVANVFLFFSVPLSEQALLDARGSRELDPGEGTALSGSDSMVEARTLRTSAIVLRHSR